MHNIFSCADWRAWKKEEEKKNYETDLLHTIKQMTLSCFVKEKHVCKHWDLFTNSSVAAFASYGFAQINSFFFFCFVKVPLLVGALYWSSKFLWDNYGQRACGVSKQSRWWISWSFATLISMKMPRNQCRYQHFWT